MMRNFTKPHPACPPSPVELSDSTNELPNKTPSITTPSPRYNFAEKVRYLSDSSSDDDSGYQSDEDIETKHAKHRLLPRVPPLKRQNLDEPVLVQREKSRKKWLADMAAALLDLKKIIKSKKANFVGVYMACKCVEQMQ
jgi:hypothetical protein